MPTNSIRLSFNISFQKSCWTLRIVFVLQFIFVEFWPSLEIMRYGVNFFFCIDVNQTDCTFQFKKYFSGTTCVLSGGIDYASVAFLKSVSIFCHLGFYF